MAWNAVAAFWFSLGAAAPEREPELCEADLIAAFDCTSASHLGSGAFGETWKVETGAQAEAVKVILQADYPLARLEREAEGLRRGSGCAHVVELRDVARATIGGADRAYFRFEYVPGGDAGRHLRQGRWPDHAELVAFVRGVLVGLAALHDADSVHRDVKLENIALRNGSWTEPVVLDLGLVRLLDGGSLTTYPAIMGTLAYMAPEQLREERARKATDLWALGVIAYLLSEREHPFYRTWEQRVGHDEALALLEAGLPRPPQLAPPALTELIKKWLDPQIYRRGSARSALTLLDSYGGDE